jgi:diguanylate cyclase (GGDEF)-like protein
MTGLTNYLLELEHSSVGDRVAHVEVLHVDSMALDGLNLFLKNSGQTSAPVLSRSLSPVALVERHSFIEFFARPYTKELHRRTRLIDLPETIIIRQPIVVDFATSMDNVAQQVVDGGVGQMAAGFIVTKDDRYLGVGNGHSLLEEMTRRRQNELYSLAHYDLLTGLPNRRLFLDRINSACQRARRHGQLIALMFVDVDRFKLINDTYGHGVGDQLLREVGQRISQCAKEGDIVARLGGDEFAYISTDLDCEENATATASRIVNGMAAPFLIDGNAIQVTLSIGIAIYPSDSNDISRLLAQADTAMYSAKKNGRNGYRRFDSESQRDIFDFISLESEMRTALERDEFYLHFQPVVAFGTRTSDKVEALIRWNHPRRGHLSPGSFISLAEKSPLIIDIGAWVLRTACEQLARWREDGVAIRHVAVNVSARQLQDEAFILLVQEAIRKNSLDPGQLILEVTEGLLLQLGPRMVSTFKLLRDLGAYIVLDDFGTGFSSLNYLRQLPLDGLKIDRSFVRGIDGSSSAARIVQSIAGLARGLGMWVTVEGVENTRELESLKACECDEAQGYLFSRPLSAADLVSWVMASQWQGDDRP